MSACIDGEGISVEGVKVKVADTVGAGDSFMSALLAAMNSDGALGRGARTLNHERLAAWLAFAAAAAAFTCTRRGSDPPTRKEMTALGFA
jgi:fructokinase